MVWGTRVQWMTAVHGQCWLLHSSVYLLYLIFSYLKTRWPSCVQFLESRKHKALPPFATWQCAKPSKSTNSVKNDYLVEPTDLAKKEPRWRHLSSKYFDPVPRLTMASASCEVRTYGAVGRLPSWERKGGELAKIAKERDSYVHCTRQEGPT